MSDQLLSNLFADFRKLRVAEVRFGGNGEPLLHPRVLPLVEEFGRDFKFKIVTNGSLLDRLSRKVFARLHKLTISLNAVTPEIHQRIHGYSGQNQFEGILQNIRRLLEWPDARGRLQINYVLTRNNMSELDDVLNTASTWRVPFAIRPAFPSTKSAAQSMLNAAECEAVAEKLRNCSQREEFRHKRMKRTLRMASASFHDTTSAAARPQLQPCYAGFYGAYIESDGTYKICCQCSTTLGNVNDATFREIWQNPTTQATILSAALMHETQQSVCLDCARCREVRVYSMPFHRCYRRLPGTMARTRAQLSKMKRTTNVLD